MEIIRKSCAEGAREAEGLAVIIDVFRAFSCQPLFFHFGANRIMIEAGPDEALALKKANPDYILVGEIDEVPMEGGDMGNSPTEIIKKGRAFFEGRTVIHRTTAGVVGATAASEKADEVLLGSFVTAGAVTQYIRQRRPNLLTLVAMGDRAARKAPEDEACADYLEHLLTGKPYDPAAAFKEVVFQPTAQKFIQGAKPYLPREDPIFCLQRDLFHFTLRVEKADEGLEVLKVQPV
jgi:2-phosphosulfolactate phosphatase